MSDVLDSGDHFECAVCGHEWQKAPEERVVVDANGQALQNGDSVSLIKELKLKGGGGNLKIGTKVKNIRLVDGDHELDCKINGVGVMLKACFVKKA